MAFTIGAPSRTTQRKHIALASIDLMGALLGGSEIGAGARKRRSDGERKAAALLEGLPETYVVFNHFVPVPSGELPARWRVDHVVIGPSGVFVIEIECANEVRVYPASISKTTAAHVKSVQRRASQFRHALAHWSAGSLGDVFVRPVLVYAHDRAYIEKLQEGPVKVIPARWLVTELTERGFEQLTPDQVYRIAHALFEQLPHPAQRASQPELDRLGAIARSWLAQQVGPRPPLAEAAP